MHLLAYANGCSWRSRLLTFSGRLFYQVQIASHVNASHDHRLATEHDVLFALDI